MPTLQLLFTKLFLRMAINSWQSLFKQLEIVELSAEEYEIDSTEFEYEVMSIEGCENVERELGIVLPHAYKEFCQVFGSGLFGDEFIEIHCPTDIWLKSYHPMKLDIARRTIVNLPDTIFMNKQEVINLVDSAFVFGGHEEVIVFWDMRTYRKEDDSYDIYWMMDEPLNGEIFRVGRDFEKFIQEFCLDDGLLRCLPPTMHEFADRIAPTFQPYPRIPRKYWQPFSEQ